MVYAFISRVSVMQSILLNGFVAETAYKELAAQLSMLKDEIDANRLAAEEEMAAAQKDNKQLTAELGRLRSEVTTNATVAAATLLATLDEAAELRRKLEQARGCEEALVNAIVLGGGVPPSEGTCPAPTVDGLTTVAPITCPEYPPLDDGKVIGGGLQPGAVRLLECDPGRFTMALDGGVAARAVVCHSDGNWSDRAETRCEAWSTTATTTDTTTVTSSPTTTPTPDGLAIKIDGAPTVRGITCKPGEYSCQAKQLCEKLTGLPCIHQGYDCFTGSKGSWYPTGSPGGSSFNFAYAYDFGGGGSSGYGNICCGTPSLCRKYNIPKVHTSAGEGRWHRV